MPTITPTTLSGLISALHQASTICIINQLFDLNGATVYIASGVTIRFEGGGIKNGTLFGDQASIPTSLEVSGSNYVFENVTLDGWWQGYCSDLYFKYDADSHDSFYPIMLNLLAFERVELHRPLYFFQWPVPLDPDNPDSNHYRAVNGGDHPFHLDGHNATFYIAKDKGATTVYDWGWKRVCYSLIELDYGRREVSIQNLNIIDNNDISPFPDYGEEDCDQPEVISGGEVVPGTEQINYCIFSGIAKITSFSNIRYDGGGCFHSAINEVGYMESLKYSDCDLFTKGFVLEVANETPQTRTLVGLDQIIIDHCKLHSHVNKYAGPLSFVGSAGVKQMRITHSKICGYRGNSEFFGIKSLLVDNCILVNQGPSSEFSNNMPVLVKYTNCHFFFTEDYVDHAYAAAGKNMYFSDNIFQIEHRLDFSDAERLLLFNNIIIVPSSDVNCIFSVNDSVKIGYYHNNAVVCPKLYENHVNLRLDNPYVIAMYSPFKVAFCSDQQLHCYSFNLWNSLQEMCDQNVTTDIDGYARTLNESLVVLSPEPKNNTVSITLIGKMFSADDIHSVASFAINNVTANSGTVSTEITITQSYGWIYLVSVGNTPLAYVSAVKYKGFYEDVRLDVTATAVNGVFEIFVFVNNQIFAKARYADSLGLTAGPLTITPNPSTGIRCFRYVSGGFIADEPDQFIDESVLN